MNSIAEMTGQKEDFIWSNRLQGVMTGLGKILDNQSLTTDEVKAFNSFGDLLGQIYLESEHYQSEEHPELSTKATELRPLFYEAAFKKRIHSFNSKYFKRVYQTLKFAGSQNELSYEEIYQAQEIFQSMHDTLLLKLQAGSGHL